MATATTLTKIIESLDSFDEDDTGSTIYLAKPWTLTSVAMVLPGPDGGLIANVPEEAREAGLVYFMEVFVAQEFIEGWLSNLDATPSLQEQAERLIQYGINDA